MKNLQRLLLTGDTAVLRFWFGFAAIGYAAFALGGMNGHYEYSVTMQVMSKWAWATVFSIVGCVTIYSAVTSKYNRCTLIFEGFLGVGVWTAMSISSAISQGSIGAVTIAAVVSVFLLVRYPTW